jgi:hypothetical protein
MLTHLEKMMSLVWGRYRFAWAQPPAPGDYGDARSSRERIPARVLSELGLHASILSAGPHDPMSDRVSTALAAAEFGDTQAALRTVGPDPRVLSRRDRERLALAIGRWSPNAAMGLSPIGASLLNSALALRAGQPERAAQIFPHRASTHAGDHDLMASGMATARADYRAARRLANQAFVRCGLAPPLDETSDAPISLAAFACGPLPQQTGPLVSVIMPARNAADTIAIAIKSVLAQTWQPLELLVVDDASTDATIAAAAAAIGTDPRARILLRPGQGGAYAARNDGLRQARGVFVTCNDADDWSHPQRIAHDVRPLIERQALMATASRLVRLDQAGQFTAARVFPLIRANPSSLLVRREAVLSALGGFEEVPVGADEEFAARLMACFGTATLLRCKTLLSVAHAGGGSLTGGGATGLLSPEGVRARIGYREDWHRRHQEIHRALVDRARGPARAGHARNSEPRPWMMPVAHRL